MNFNDYQEAANKSSLYANFADQLPPLAFFGLGLTGESGEVAEKIKKLYRDEQGKITPEFKENFIKEMGDVLWYLSQIATVLEIPLSQIAETNIAKIKARQKRNVLQGNGDNR